MQDASKHIIHSFILDLNAVSQDDLEWVNERLGKVDFEALFDRVLSEYQFFPVNIRIDRLELEAGWLSLDDEHALISFLETQLRSAIEKAIDERIHKWENMQDKKIWTKSLGEDEQVKDWEMVLYYLVHGTLPWYAPADADIKGILMRWIDRQDLNFLERMRTDGLLPDAYFRLMQITSYELLEPLMRNKLDWRITRYLGRVHEPVVLFIRGIRPEMAAPINELIYPLWLRAVVHSWGLNDFVDHWMKDLQKFFSTLSHKHLVQVQKIAMTPFLQKGEVWTDTIVEKLYAYFESLSRSFELEASTTKIGPSGKLLWRDMAEDVIHPVEWDLADQLYPDAAEGDDQPDQWFITHAGLVLLNAGLLSRYFEQFGWVVEGRITSQTAADAMRQWMHYLVWGEQQAYEYDYLLGKVLTGCPIESAVSLHSRLEAHHIEAANEMLGTVIAHWSRLKQTSIDALRTGFLQRNGILRRDASGWQLHVETKGQDILMDYLPWTYSIIKFPWMDKPLFTQWNTGI